MNAKEKMVLLCVQMQANIARTLWEDLNVNVSFVANNNELMDDQQAYFDNW